MRRSVPHYLSSVALMGDSCRATFVHSFLGYSAAANRKPTVPRLLSLPLSHSAAPDIITCHAKSRMIGIRRLRPENIPNQVQLVLRALAGRAPADTSENIG